MKVQKLFIKKETEKIENNKLPNLYNEYFQYDKEFDNLIEPYNEIIQSIQFINEKTQFVKLNVVSKEFIDKDFKSPVINVKMIDLNRQTMPLYKRLDEKNKSCILN